MKYTLTGIFNLTLENVSRQKLVLYVTGWLILNVAAIAGLIAVATWAAAVTANYIGFTAPTWVETAAMMLLVSLTAWLVRGIT